MGLLLARLCLHQALSVETDRWLDYVVSPSRASYAAWRHAYEVHRFWLRRCWGLEA